MGSAPGASWTLTVRGDSMRPLLKAGDRIRVRRVALAELRPGDLAVVMDWRGGAPDFVVHRLLAAPRRGGRAWAWTKGDANFLPDPLTPAAGVVGVVEAVSVPGGWIAPGPRARRRGAALALSAPVILRASSWPHRAAEAVAGALWSRVLLPSRARGAQAKLLAARAANQRAASAVLDGLQRLARAWTLDAGPVEPAGEEPPREVLGILDGDQVWSGRVRLEGDAFVPPGSTLRVTAGTRVEARPDSQWDFPRECRILSDWSAALEPRRCRLFVAGRLVVEGEEGAPAVFTGGPWGGIHFFGGSWGSSIRGARLSGCAGPSVGVWGEARASLARVEIEGGETGVTLAGGTAGVELEDCAVRGVRRRGLSCAGGALAARRVRLEDCGEAGAFGDEGAELELEDCVARGGRDGVVLRSGRARLTRVAAEGASGSGFVLDGSGHGLSGCSARACGTGVSFGGAELAAEDLVIDGCGAALVHREGAFAWRGGAARGGDAGVESSGESLSLERVALSGFSGAALSARGARARLDAVAVEDCGTALLLEGGTLDASGLSAVRCGAGARLLGGVRAALEGARMSGLSGDALSARGGSLELEDLSVDGAGCGLRLEEGARARAKDAAFARLTGEGVRAEGGSLELEGLVVAGAGMGLSLASVEARVTRAALSRLEADGVRAEGGSLVLRASSVDEAVCGVRLSGGRAELEGVRLRGAPDCGLKAADARVEARGLAVEDCGTALLLEGGTLDASGLSAVRCGAGARLLGGVRAALEGARMSGLSGDALSARGGSLELEDLSVDGAGCGLRLEEGARARAKDAAFARLTGEGVRAEGGSLELEGLVVAGAGMGLSLASVEARVTRAALSRLEADGVRAEGGSLVLRASSVDEAVRGVSLSGTRGEIEDLRLRRCAEGGFEAADSRVEARRLVVEDAARGVSLAGGSAALEDVSLRRFAGCGLEAADSRVEARGLVVEDAGKDALALHGSGIEAAGARLVRPGSAAVRAEDSRVILSGASFDGGEAGLLSWDGETTLSACVANGQRDAAFRQERGGLRLLDCEASACGAGAVVPEGSLEVRGGRFRGCAGAALECGGPARVAGASVSGCGAGLVAWPAAAVELEGVEFSDLRGHGVELRGGALSAADCRWTRVGGVGVRLEDGARARLRDCALRGTSFGVGAASGSADLARVRVVEASRAGISLESGAHRLEAVSYYACADGLHAAEAARVEVVAPPEEPRLEGAYSALKRALLLAVLRTRRLPAAARLYRAACGAPLRLLQARALLDPSAAFFGVHRSWSGPDWEPGTSDVDLLSCERGLAGEEGRRRLERLWRGQAGLKRAFPFLGERLVMEAEELSEYRRSGGFRARGLDAQFLALAGRLPEGSREATPASPLERLGESAHAYTRLMSWALWRPLPSDWAAMQARKAALDLLRLEAAGPGGPAELPPRAAALAAAGEAAEPFRAPLEALARGTPGAGPALCAAAAELLRARAAAALSSIETRSAPPGEDGGVEAPRAEREARRRRRGLLEAAMGPALVAGACDDLYRSTLVLSDASLSTGEAEAAFAGLAAAIRRDEGPSTLPLVMSETAWRAWSLLPYLESPSGGLESGGDDERLTPAGAGVPGAWLYRWGRLAAPAAPADLGDAAAREALATFRCIWRHQISPVSGLSEAYAFHYALSRTLGLRLLIERGVAAPFFGLDRLRALYAREFPEEAEGLRALDARIAALDRPPRWSDYYAWVDGALRRRA